ncbi:MAG: hypothetical protein RRX92_01695 [Lachnospiraceae bacterium]
MDLEYVELAKATISQDVLYKFDCKHPDFNDFLINDAIKFASDSHGVTYILIDAREREKEISAIFAFCTIKASALYSSNGNAQTMFSLSCAEIKYFAIHRSYQKTKFGKLGIEKYFSTIFFELLLMDLYELSTKTIGFEGIFLRANENGEKLYRRKNFVDATQYIIPYEEDDELGKCTPMFLSISDNIYNIFGC